MNRITEVLFDPKSRGQIRDVGEWRTTDLYEEGEKGGTVIFRHHVPWVKESDASVCRVLGSIWG